MPSKPGIQRDDPIVNAWADRFHLSITQPTRLLKPQLCRQLSQCKNDSARRILLGVKP